MRHKLLVRQLRRSLGVSSEKQLQERLAALRARGDHDLAQGFETLLALTSRSYDAFERDLQVRTRMLEISSEELTSANEKLRLKARDQLAAKEAANQRILNSLREVVFQTDPSGNWVYLNPAWAHITGFGLDETLGTRALDYIHEDDQRANMKRLNALVARDEHYFRSQMRFRTKGQGYRWLEVFARRLDEESGRSAGLSGSLIDITDQKLAQDQLIISEQRLNQALAATASRLWDWDLRTQQPYVDPAWLNSLGYPNASFANSSVEWHKQLHPDDLVRWRGHLREHLKRERAELDIELRFRTVAGEWRYGALRGKVVVWDGSRALRMAGTLQDITPRKEAEAAALRQQEMTEQILDQLPIPVFLKDREGRFVRFNRKFLQYSRFTREQILGKRIEEFASPNWSMITHKEDEQAWRTGQMVTSERRLNNVDPPIDLLVNRIVITSGGESFLLGFSIDISEPRAAREAMQRAVESAEAASRAKGEFLANMSHEIRTPMNGILGMTELVLESNLTPGQREDLALVKASADALLTIINDVLDFSKVEAGKLDIEEVPFNLRQFANDTLRSMGLRAQQKGLELRLDLPDNLPATVRGDPGRLRQVLLNLLGNAIKFTQAGTVTLSLRAGQHEAEHCDIEFAVSDTGIGIPSEKRAMIFEPFSQVDGSTTREYGGTGLGLTICRRLVILMQGEIELASEPGAGSTFSFTLPMRLAGAHVEGQALPQPELQPLVQPLETAPAGAAGDEEGAGLRILLAEDNPVNQRLAVRLLERMGHRIVLVDNGQAAVERITSGAAYDLVLMDVQMPVLDGLSATRYVRQWEQRHGGHVPIIAMTARAMQGDRERCLEAGMDDYLSKPIDSQRLRQLIAQFEPQAVLAWPEALQRLDGDEALLLELAAIFLDDGPAMQQALMNDIGRGDIASAQRGVHSLKGVLVNFGAQRAIAAAERLNTSLLDPSQSALWPDLALALAPVLDEAYQALSEKVSAGVQG
jgi:PAS domain S-box-containing protein